MGAGQRDSRPLSSAINRAVETAPVRPRIEELRIAVAYGKSTHIQGRQPLIAGLPGFPSIARPKDTTGPADVENVRIGRMHD